MAAPSDLLPSSLVLIGAGKMGGAMLEGWLARGIEPPESRSSIPARPRI